MSDRPESLLSDDAAMAEIALAIESLQNDTGNTTPLSTALVNLTTAAVDEPVKSIPLAHSLITAVESPLDAETLTATLTEAFKSLDGDEARIEILATSLLESFDAIHNVAADVDDLVKNEPESFNSESATKAAAIVQSLVQSGACPKHIPNLILAPPLLLPLHLHPTPRTPDYVRKRLTQMNTSIHFKQGTTNLLRENSEGFSRLIVLLTGPMSLFTQPESDEERVLRAKRIWDRIRDLIGFFNLAPIRVYDLILEVATSNIEKHWRFFLELLRQASLGPKETPAVVSQGSGIQADVERITHALDVSADDDAMIARALAFRLRWARNSSNERHPLPLMFLTALLIKYGFVKPGHILPILSPSQDAMSDIQKRVEDGLRSRSGAVNALMNTVLVDDDAPDGGAATPAEIVEPAEPEAELKIMLLQALIAIGESDFSLFLIAENTWLVSAYPRIADLIIRRLDYSMSELYQRAARHVDYGDDVELHPRNAEVVLTTSYPPPPSTVSTQWKFFYDNWMETIEVWTQPLDITTKGERWFSVLKGLGSRSDKLMSALCRVILSHFAELRREKIENMGFNPARLTHDQKAEVLLTDNELKPYRGLIRNTILPALNVSESVGKPFADDVGEIFGHMNWATKANLLGEWRDQTTNIKERAAILPAAHAANQASREVRQALQRVTAANKEAGQSNTAQTADRGPARALAKHGHGNPLALWTVGNGQVMSYGTTGNIGEFFMEVARFSGSLSRDVAVFTWVETLASKTDPRQIENLSTFVGIINRQFAFDLEPILLLIATGIKQHKMFALPLVEKLLTGMTGEDIVENHAISIAQLQSYASGPEMTREAFYASENTMNEDRRPVRSRELLLAADKSSSRLIQALKDTGLAVPILVGLGRLATEALLYQPGVPIKAMSDKKDATRDVFSLWCGFVADKLPEIGCANQIPSLKQLQGDGNLDEQMCWAILRPKLRAELAKARLENGNGNGDANGMDVDGTTPANDRWWPAVLNDTVVQADAFLTPTLKIVLGGAGFLVRFNSLRISDIAVNEDSYKAARDNIAKILRQLQSMPGANSKRDSEVRRLKERDNKLKIELEKQKAHIESVRTELLSESKQWFAKCVEHGHEGILARLLHEHCFYLRAIQTPADAIFVARFVRLLHDLDTFGFSTIHAYDQFFKDSLASKLYESTESEARNLGRALMLMMGDLDSWHSSAAKYQTEALGKADTSAEPTKHGMFQRIKAGEPKIPIPYPRFKNMLAKMHGGLKSALLTCWTDGLFYAPKNAVVIALQLLPYFPIMEGDAREIEGAVKALLAKTDGSITPDMKPAFNSYLSQLKTRANQRPFISAAEFYPNGAKMEEMNRAKAKAEAEAKAKEEAAAKAKAEEEAAAKAKAEEEARAKAEAEKPTDEKMHVDLPTESAPKTETTPPAAAAEKADPKVLRAKLEKQREARKAAAAAEAASPQRQSAPPTSESTAMAPPGDMAPPPEPSVEDSRAAARARRFGALASSNSSAPGTPRADGASTPRAGSPRRTRAGTDDSRVSERSRWPDERDRRDRERGGRDRDSRDGRDGGNSDRRDGRGDGRDRDSRRGGRRDDGRDGRRDGRGERGDRTPRDSRDGRGERRLEPEPRGRDERHRDERRGEERPRARSSERYRDRDERDSRDSHDGRDRRDGRDGRDARRDEPGGASIPPRPKSREEQRSPRRPQSRNEQRSPRRPESRNEEPPRRPESRNEGRDGRNDRDRRDRDHGRGDDRDRDQRDGKDRSQPVQAMPSPLVREAPPHREERARDMRSPRRDGRDGRRSDARDGRDGRDGRERRRDEPPRDGGRERDGRPNGRDQPRRDEKEAPSGPSGRSPPKDGSRTHAKDSSPRKDEPTPHPAESSQAPSERAARQPTPQRRPSPHRRADQSPQERQERQPSPQRIQPSPAREVSLDQTPGLKLRRDPPTGPSGLPAPSQSALPEKPQPSPTAPADESKPATAPIQSRLDIPGRSLSSREKRGRGGSRGGGGEAGGGGSGSGSPATAAPSLAARMGLMLGGSGGSSSGGGGKGGGGGSGGGGSERGDRKRPLDSEGAPSSREGSPGSKRHRRGGKGRREEERSGGLGRMFQNAMRQSSEKKK